MGPGEVAPGRGQHQPRVGHVGARGTGDRVGPVDDHRTVRGDQHVLGMEVEVEERGPVAEGAGQPVGAGDGMEPLMELGQ